MTMAVKQSAHSTREIPSSLALLLGATRTISARMSGPLSAFLLTMLLARLLGAEGTGTFYVALTLMTACATLAKFGLETALQRFIGAAHGHGEQAAVVGIYRQALKIVSLLAVAIATLLLLGAELLSELVFRDPGQAQLIRTIALLLIPFSLMGIHGAMLKGIGKPAWGSFFEAAAWPLLALGMVGVMLLGDSLSSQSVAVAHLLAAILALAFAYRVLSRYLPEVQHTEPLEQQRLVDSCVPLTVVELTNYALLWTPFLMLPALASVEEAGLYNVSHRLAAQLGLLMIVFSSLAAPRFAAHHKADDHAGMAVLAGRTTRTMLLFGIPASLLLLIWPELILGLFGESFLPAADALRILVIGQLFSLASGPAGYLLAMTGQEKVLRNVVVMSLVMTLPLALMLIPSYGAAGAALAVAIPMIFQNVVCCSLSVQRLKLPFFLMLAR